MQKGFFNLCSVAAVLLLMLAVTKGFLLPVAKVCPRLSPAVSATDQPENTDEIRRGQSSCPGDRELTLSQGAIFSQSTVFNMGRSFEHSSGGTSTLIKLAKRTFCSYTICFCRAVSKCRFLIAIDKHMPILPAYCEPIFLILCIFRN